MNLIHEPTKPKAFALHQHFRPSSGIEDWELGIIIGLACAVSLVFIVVCALYRAHYRKKLNKKEEEIRIANETDIRSIPRSSVRRLLAMDSIQSPSVTGEVKFHGLASSYGDNFAHISIPLDKTWEIEREQLRIDGPLGEGAFGRVLKATAIAVDNLPQMHPVAIKTLKGLLKQQCYECR